MGKPHRTALSLSCIARHSSHLCAVCCVCACSYEGTGRSLSLKLIAQLRQQSVVVAPASGGASASASAAAGAVSAAGVSSGRVLRELTLETPIRYAPFDPIEKWLNDLLCLDCTQNSTQRLRTRTTE
jgi:N-acetyltransferase 10